MRSLTGSSVGLILAILALYILTFHPPPTISPLNRLECEGAKIHITNGSGDQQQNDNVSWPAWLTKDAAGFFTFLLAIVGIGQACLFFFQLRYMRQGLVGATDAANASRKGSEAARDSADTARLSMIAGQRAYVFYHGMRWISHLDINDGRIFWSLRPQWINSGNTPTRNMRVYVDYELRDNALPDDYEFLPIFADTAPPAIIAPSGVISCGHFNLRGEDLAAVQNGTKFLYVWGVARYRDVFPDTPERVTKFCVFAQNVTGDPRAPWDEKTNPVEIILPHYSQHNCCDEEGIRLN